MRIGDAEREALFDQLSRHAAAGRIDVPELERRVAAIAAAETREEAAAVMADLPPLPSAPPGRPARGDRADGPDSQSKPVRFGRGHGEADAPAPDWQPTSERFRDPRTNRIMRVWVDASGGRHYVTDEPIS